MEIKKGLLYSEDHEWVKVEEDCAYIGISDFAQDALGSIVFVELPDCDAEIDAGDTFGVVESVKAASDMYLPVGGTVIETNVSLEDNPENLNEDCYNNWIIKIKMADVSELDNLMTPESYEKFCQQEA